MKPTPWHEFSLGDYGIQYWTITKNIDIFIITGDISDLKLFTILGDAPIDLTMAADNFNHVVQYYKTGKISNIGSIDEYRKGKKYISS